MNSPDDIDRMEALKALSQRGVQNTAVIGQNGPVEPFGSVSPMVAYPPLISTPSGLQGTPAPQRDPDALLPGGKVRLHGQVYEWAEMKSGAGAWVVVVG